NELLSGDLHTGGARIARPHARIEELHDHDAALSDSQLTRSVELRDHDAHRAVALAGLQRRPDLERRDGGEHTGDREHNHQLRQAVAGWIGEFLWHGHVTHALQDSKERSELMRSLNPLSD